MLTGVTLGVLYNPWTGQSTRDWIMDRVAGGNGTGLEELDRDLAADAKAQAGAAADKVADAADSAADKVKSTADAAADKTKAAADTAAGKVGSAADKVSSGKSGTNDA